MDLFAYNIVIYSAVMISSAIRSAATRAKFKFKAGGTAQRLIGHLLKMLLDQIKIQYEIRIADVREFR